MSLQWHLDEITRAGPRLHVRGWAFHPRTRITRVLLRPVPDSEGQPLAGFGLASPDVALVFGHAAANARFDEILDAWLADPGRELGFEFVLADGTVETRSHRVVDADQPVESRVESPSSENAVEPLDFYVSGWLYAKQDHAAIRAIEVWSEGMMIGSTSTLFMRPDVCATLAVSTSCAMGFVVTCHRMSVIAEHGMLIAVQARFRDGSVRGLLPAGGRLVPLLPPARAPLSALRARVAKDALGVEIGAHAAPATGVRPYYTDVTSDFAGSEGRVDFLADGQALPLADESLDYLCSSHVLEHLPNPLAALFEWHRVLRPGGLLYLVVPDKRFTFDQPRAVTMPDHLLRDFLVGRTTATSMPHIREFIYETDWSRLQPGCPAADEEKNRDKAYKEYVAHAAAGQLIGIHFHTFIPSSFRKALRQAGLIDVPSARFEVLSAAERYPSSRGDGIGFLLRKRGESRRRSPQTYLLRSPDDLVPPLPLVCPVTLASLGEEGGGLRTTANGRPQYEFTSGRPNLIPAPGALIRRQWATLRFRIWVYLRGWKRRARVDGDGRDKLTFDKGRGDE